MGKTLGDCVREAIAHPERVAHAAAATLAANEQRRQSTRLAAAAQGGLAQYTGSCANSNPAADAQEYDARQEEEREKLLRRAERQRTEERKRERQRAATMGGADGSENELIRLKAQVEAYVEREREEIQNMVSSGIEGLGDVAGLGDVVEQLQEATVDRFDHPDVFGGDSTQGVLLYGPPGVCTPVAPSHLCSLLISRTVLQVRVKHTSLSAVRSKHNVRERTLP